MPDDPAPTPRYAWPRYVIAALVISVILAVLWVSAEVRRMRERKALVQAFEEATASNKPAQTKPSPEELAQWRVELAELGATKSAAADTNLAAWLDKLLAGQVPAELQLEVLEAAGKHDSPAVQQRWQRYKSSLPAGEPLTAYRDLLFGGNAETGRKVFYEKPEANCAKCHRIGDTGAEIGPPLNGIGAKQSREQILESILFPNAKTVEGYESVILLLKNGGAVCGVLRKETETELVVNSEEDGMVTVKKADVQTRRPALSPMPEGLWQLLSRRELRNLVEFLAAQK